MEKKVQMNISRATVVIVTSYIMFKQLALRPFWKMRLEKPMTQIPYILAAIDAALNYIFPAIFILTALMIWILKTIKMHKIGHIILVKNCYYRAIFHKNFVSMCNTENLKILFGICEFLLFRVLIIVLILSLSTIARSSGDWGWAPPWRNFAPPAKVASPLQNFAPIWKNIKMDNSIINWSN